jgi:hypothetical protein
VQLKAFIDDAALAVGEPVLRHGGCDRVEMAGNETLDAVVHEDLYEPADRSANIRSSSFIQGTGRSASP